MEVRQFGLDKRCCPTHSPHVANRKFKCGEYFKNGTFLTKVVIFKLIHIFLLKTTQNART
jgi:hypothetical protein